MKKNTIVNVINISMALLSIGFAAGCLALSTTDEGNTSSGGAGSGRCSSVEDCPSVTICTTMKCLDGSCVPGFVQVGLQCNDTRVCDGAGTCVGCVDSSKCKGSNPTCENNECISCSDGIQNGEETAVDCGGSRCDSCPLGTPCSSNNDCSEGNDCVDGVCCDSSCTVVCKACNVAGNEGTCTAIPKGSTDPGKCEMNKVCGGTAGSCLLKDGQPCTQSSACLGGFCFNGFCITP
jgi:hypothetical protein